MHDDGLNEITRTIGLPRPCGRDDGTHAAHAAACTDLPEVERTPTYMTFLDCIGDPQSTTD